VVSIAKRAAKVNSGGTINVFVGGVYLDETGRGGGIWAIMKKKGSVRKSPRTKKLELFLGVESTVKKGTAVFTGRITKSATLLSGGCCIFKQK